MKNGLSGRNRAAWKERASKRFKKNTAGFGGGAKRVIQPGAWRALWCGGGPPSGGRGPVAKKKSYEEGHEQQLVKGIDRGPPEKKRPRSCRKKSDNSLLPHPANIPEKDLLEEEKKPFE